MTSANYSGVNAGAANSKPASLQDADVIVIGGGPGGYVAALLLGMLGASVIVVERDRVGGTCLNRGCIPTKALLQSAELFEQLKSGARMGVEADNVRLNLAGVDAYQSQVVQTLVKGVEGLLKARKVELIQGEACFDGPKSLRVRLSDGGERRLSAPNIIIATGSKPSSPPIPGLDGLGVIDSTQALNVMDRPDSMVIIGGGVIGMELGAVYAAFGTKITVIEALDTILPNMDREIAKEYTRIAKRKITIHTGARVSGVADGPDAQKRVEFFKADQALEVTADRVLVAIGRSPDTSALGLEKAGIAAERGAVLVDENFSTNVSGVYCIGDANGKLMLAHAASAQGITVADRIMGKEPEISLSIVPSCIYTDPEIAAVGLTEEQVKERGIPYKVGRFTFRANGRSLILGKNQGFVKIIGSTAHNEVLGVHIIGPHATELIGECAMVMQLEGCVEDIAHTIHAHPTVGESIMEAAEAYLGGAIHSL